MDITHRKFTEINLRDDAAMDVTLAATTHLYSVSKEGGKKKIKDKRHKG